MKTKQTGAYQGCTLQEYNTDDINRRGGIPVYGVLLFEGTGTVKVDITEYSFTGRTVLFTAPYQVVYFKLQEPLKMRSLQFHGDFYCIEYHKAEVACNGLLFNNIYQQPYISPEADDFLEMNYIFSKLAKELGSPGNYAQAVVRAYLQLVLAIGSRIKSDDTRSVAAEQVYHPVMNFKQLLEKHFLRERQPAFYAAEIGISANAFSKLCRQHFLKTPSALIQERVILESKKLIHLTYKSMKQIAAELHFNDENYFSRYFKKHTGVTPTAFREHVGISIVADLSR
jgi:AraC family transcriptional activator of pobA